MTTSYARKRFGQHFLIDKNLLQQIVNTIAPAKEDHVVEIGPGHGELTQYLLPRVTKLDVIEIDRDLIAQLKQRFEQYSHLTIHESDALKFNFETLISKDHGIRIVGNLPYNISTPLLFKCFSFIHRIKDMHFLLQKEVVHRLCAAVGSSHYGRLSVMAQYYCDNTLVFEIGPDAFKPPPKVDSALIRLIPRQKRLIDTNDINTLTQIVKEAFNQRRKTIRNTLKKSISEKSLMDLSIDPQLRPQQLSVDDYIRISNAITIE